MGSEGAGPTWKKGSREWGPGTWQGPVGRPAGPSPVWGGGGEGAFGAHSSRVGRQISQGQKGALGGLHPHLPRSWCPGSAWQAGPGPATPPQHIWLPFPEPQHSFSRSQETPPAPARGPAWGRSSHSGRRSLTPQHAPLLEPAPPRALSSHSLSKGPGCLGAVTALQLQELQREDELGEQLQARRLMPVEHGSSSGKRPATRAEDLPAGLPELCLLKGASWYF